MLFTGVKYGMETQGEPVQCEDGWKYKVILHTKDYHFLGIKIWTKKKHKS